jgi:hypothetical protein
MAKIKNDTRPVRIREALVAAVTKRARAEGRTVKAYVEQAIEMKMASTRE